MANKKDIGEVIVIGAKLATPPPRIRIETIEGVYDLHPVDRFKDAERKKWAKLGAEMGRMSDDPTADEVVESLDIMVDNINAMMKMVVPGISDEALEEMPSSLKQEIIEKAGEDFLQIRNDST